MNFEPNFWLIPIILLAAALASLMKKISLKLKKSTPFFKKKNSNTEDNKDSSNSGGSEPKKELVMDDLVFVKTMNRKKNWGLIFVFFLTVSLTLLKIQHEFPLAFQGGKLEIFLAAVVTIVVSVLISAITKPTTGIYQPTVKKVSIKQKSTTDYPTPKWVNTFISQYKTSGFPWLTSKMMPILWLLGLPLATICIEILFSTYFPMIEIAKQQANQVYIDKINKEIIEIGEAKAIFDAKISSISNDTGVLMPQLITTVNQHLDTPFEVKCLVTSIPKNKKKQILNQQAAEIRTFLPTTPSIALKQVTLDELHDLAIFKNNVSQAKYIITNDPKFEASQAYLDINTRNMAVNNDCNVDDLAYGVNIVLNQLNKDVEDFNQKIDKLLKLVNKGPEEKSILSAYILFKWLLIGNVLLVFCSLNLLDHWLNKKASYLAAQTVRKALNLDENFNSVTLDKEGNLNITLNDLDFYSGGLILKSLFGKQIYLKDGADFEQNKTKILLIKKEAMHLLGVYDFSRPSSTSNQEEDK